MTVKEYANEMNVSVAEVLKKCKELGIEVSDATDELFDDDELDDDESIYDNDLAEDNLDNDDDIL